jgi:hypothetical protein
LRAPTNLQRGKQTEQKCSRWAHQGRQRIPLLVDETFLRQKSLGQVDLAALEKVNDHWALVLYEAKSSFRISAAQKNRLLAAANYLGHLFGLPAISRILIPRPGGPKYFSQTRSWHLFSYTLR